MRDRLKGERQRAARQVTGAPSEREAFARPSRRRPCLTARQPTSPSPSETACTRRSPTRSSPSSNGALALGQCQRAARPSCNTATGRQYSGINILILWSAVAERGFTAQKWLTFHQALMVGARVKKGEKGPPLDDPQRCPPSQPTSPVLGRGFGEYNREIRVFLEPSDSARVDCDTRRGQVFSTEDAGDS